MAKTITRNITILMSSFLSGIVSKTYAERDSANGQTPYLKNISYEDMQSTNALSGWSSGFPKPKNKIDYTVYHLGASLKDLGKKLFAFSKMEVTAEVILRR